MAVTSGAVRKRRLIRRPGAILYRANKRAEGSFTYGIYGNWREDIYYAIRYDVTHLSARRRSAGAGTRIFDINGGAFARAKRIENDLVLHCKYYPRCGSSENSRTFVSASAQRNLIARYVIISKSLVSPYGRPRIRESG